MGTRTVDETGARTDRDAAAETAETAEGPAPARDETTREAAATDAEQAGDPTADAPAAADPEDGTGHGPDDAEDASDTEPAGKRGPTGVGQGAGAVVSAALGLVSLTGGWVGTVASARESLIGQLETSSSSDVATLIQKGYGEAWHATAMWGGAFALAALVVGVVVLARPAFGAPGRPQAPWIKSVAWAGVTLGVIGLILAVLTYTDVLLGLPSAG